MNRAKESEETEVKGKQWLKSNVARELDLLFHRHGLNNSDFQERRANILNLIDQLDEPEVLSQEWIDEYAQGDYDEWVYTEDLQNLLVPKQEEITEEQAWEVLSELYDIPNKSYIREAMRVVADYVGDESTLGELKEQLSKQEKVKIDKEDAEIIEQYKDKGRSLSYLIDNIGAGGSYDELLARAWLDGYEVEEEQKYIVVLGKSIYNTTTYGQIGEINGNRIMQSVYASKENIITPNQYTKSEILEVKDGEDIFKRYAVKVEELKE